jgi:hypothetical protein
MRHLVHDHVHVDVHVAARSERVRSPSVNRERIA